MTVNAISPSPMLKAYINNRKPLLKEENLPPSNVDTPESDNQKQNNSKRILFGALGAAAVCAAAIGAIKYRQNLFDNLAAESKTLKQAGNALKDEAKEAFDFAKKQIDEACSIIKKDKDDFKDNPLFRYKKETDSKEDLYECIEEFAGDGSILRKIKFRESKPFEIVCFNGGKEDRIFKNDHGYLAVLKDVISDEADENLIHAKEAFKFDDKQLSRAFSNVSVDLENTEGFIPHKNCVQFVYSSDNGSVAQITKFNNGGKITTFDFDADGSLSKIEDGHNTFDLKTKEPHWSQNDPETLEDLED